MYNIDKHIEDTEQDFWEQLLNSADNDEDVVVLGNGFLCGYGTYNIRIIPENNELITVEKEFHSYYVDEECKSVTCPGKGCPICKVADEVNDPFLDSIPERLDKTLIYLIDTDSPEDWTPGKYYIFFSGISRSETNIFEKALTSFIIETLGTGINGKILLDNLFDYTKEIQGSLQFKVERGNSKSASISFDPSIKSPKLDEKIIKDLNRYTTDYINNLFKEPDLKELEEDAEKIRDGRGFKQLEDFWEDYNKRLCL